MPFDLPGKPAADPFEGRGAGNMTLPDTLKVVRDRSVTAFKERLGFFATDESIGQYRDEVDRLMRVAYEKGRIDGR